jgi:predicted kinase
MTAHLVIVGGAPATGKTELAGALGRTLGLPVITKDDVKEALAEPFATGDREWSRRLGRAASSVLYVVAERLLAAGAGVILESNFRREFESRLAALAELAPTVVIVCRVPDALRRRRFEERAAQGRHRVHIDDAITAEWNEDDAEFLIDIGAPRLIVDTTAGYAPGLHDITSFVRSATVPTR